MSSMLSLAPSLSSPALPFEVMELILSHLNPAKSLVHRKTLCNCALSSRVLLPRSRYLLFCHIHISSRRSYHLLVNLVVQIPHALSYIEFVSDLHLEDDTENPFAAEFLFFFSARLSSLKRLKLDGAICGPGDIQRFLNTHSSLTSLELCGGTYRPTVDDVVPGHLDALNSHLLRLKLLELSGNLLPALNWLLPVSSTFISIQDLIIHGMTDENTHLVAQLLESLGPALMNLACSFYTDSLAKCTRLSLSQNVCLQILYMKNSPAHHIFQIFTHIQSSHIYRIHIEESKFPSPLMRWSFWDRIRNILSESPFHFLQELIISFDIRFLYSEKDQHNVRDMCAMLPQRLGPLGNILCIRIKGRQGIEQYIQDEQILGESGVDEFITF